MDDRQMDIRESAGLEETKYDENFLSLLNKWGNRLLWLVVIVLGLYVGNQYLGKARRAHVDEAFAQYEEVKTVNPTPEAMVALAEKYDDTRGVGHLARLSAADLYLEAVRRGLVVGAVLADDGTLLTQDDALSDADRAFYLEQAWAEYQQVFDEASIKPEQAIYAIGAGFGLAAVAETLGETDLAGEWYTKVETLAGGLGYVEVAARAAEMHGALGELVLSPHLYRRDELPKLPDAPDPLGAIGGLDGLNLDPDSLAEIQRLIQEQSELEDGAAPEDAGDADSGAGDDPEDGDGSGDAGSDDDTGEQGDGGGEDEDSDDAGDDSGDAGGDGG